MKATTSHSIRRPSRRPLPPPAPAVEAQPTPKPPVLVSPDPWHLGSAVDLVEGAGRGLREQATALLACLKASTNAASAAAVHAGALGQPQRRRALRNFAAQLNRMFREADEVLR